MESTFGPAGNRKVPAIYDPSEMKKICSDAGAEKLFDFLLNTMTTEARQTTKKVIENEHKVVTLILFWHLDSPKNVHTFSMIMQF